MVLWGCPPPRGYLSVSSVPPEEHGIEGPVPRPPGGPLVGPAQPPVHLPHQGEVYGRNPRGSPDFLAYPVPKACMHVLGTRVPRCLGVARSTSSPKAAQALG